MARHLGTFDSERVQRSRGFHAECSHGRDYSSLAELLIALVLMWGIIGGGFAAVLS
jgi:hypothetical protein